MRLQEIIDTLEEVPYHSRHQVLKELENHGQISAYQATEILDYWDREDDRANELCKSMRERECEQGAFDLRGAY